MEKLETFIEKIIFAGRWFLAPLYLGLLLTLVPILYRFFHSFWLMMTHVTEATAAEITLEVLELLKDFMKEGTYDANREGWRIGIHMTFVISGVLFALMDNMADRHKSER